MTWIQSLVHGHGPSPRCDGDDGSLMRWSYRHCWVCEFDTQGAKPKVKRVRVYLDSAHALRMMSDK